MAIRKVKLVKIGTLAFEAFENPDPKVRLMKYFCGIGTGSNVVYIETDDRNIIVDTGFDYEDNVEWKNSETNRENLINSLKHYRIAPEDIDLVFITHWHRDHFGNLDVFPDAEIMAHRAHQRLDYRCREIGDREEIVEGVMVLATPGHTENHASLVLTLEDIVYHESSGFTGHFPAIKCPCIVVAGDAIVSHSYYLQNKFWDYNSDFFSKERSIRSQQMISELADYIIPGHGAVFYNTRRG
ncbi:MAG: MBL fold metallo-hydrolase [Euryarchaeota archaeon]|nr:MBL fold metallo-hydrolase [Euryarchaeota archaeon]